MAKESRQRKVSGAIEKYVIPSTSTSLSVPNTIESDLENSDGDTLRGIAVEQFKENQTTHQDTLKNDDEDQLNSRLFTDVNRKFDAVTQHPGTI